MSHPAVDKALRDAMAIGRRVIERTARDATADLREKLSVPAASAADPSFVISSAPGEFPRKRSGRLRDGVYYRTAEDSGPRLYFEIGSTAPYQRFLEQGTSRMAARPHIGPTLEKWGRILLERLKSAYGQ